MQIRHVVYGLAVAAVSLAVATSAVARVAPNGIAGHVPNYQYTNISPLPGGGIAVNSHGDLDGNGAMQVNIPVAYTPGWGYASLNEFQGEHPVKGGKDFDNGSSVFALGFFSSRRVFMSAMQVSSVWSEARAVSGQVMLTDETATAPAISVGMQDILQKEVNGRSAYAVLTKSYPVGGQKLYGTLGYGGGRFLNKPFAGVSMPLGGSLNVLTEWDGFQLNNGVGWRPGGKDGKMTVYAGYNGHTGVLLGGSLACVFSR